MSERDVDRVETALTESGYVNSKVARNLRRRTGAAIVSLPTNSEGANMKKVLTSLGAAAALALGGLAMNAPAFAASSTQTQHQHCNSADPTCGFNPVVATPIPQGVVIPANCPAFFTQGQWEIDFTDGNAHDHFTVNKNGDWGGGTANGPATFYVDNPDGSQTVEYTGHATEWFGGGQNSNPNGDPTQQSVNSFTVHFNGSGPAGTLDLHANMHTTTNNANVQTANILNANVRCS